MSLDHLMNKFIVPMMLAIIIAIIPIQQTVLAQFAPGQIPQQQQFQQQQQQLQGQGSTQPSRVGIHDNAQQTSPEGANPGGTVTDPTLAGNFPDGTVKANCFGVVISDRAQEHKENPDEGTLGSHASDPVPEIPGHETPRQGIGNQDQGHPAAHGAFNSQFDPDDLANAQQNCWTVSTEEESTIKNELENLLSNKINMTFDCRHVYTCREA